MNWLQNLLRSLKNLREHRLINKYFSSLSVVCCLLVSSIANAALPDDFVYLSAIDPSIRQDIRYAGEHNFIGSPIKGYNKAECILTKSAALALAKVQKNLVKQGLSLQVYDCYRPQSAVDQFIAWSSQPNLQQMREEFYPRVDKSDFFKLGYVAAKSGHTRGSTVDLTIISPLGATQHYKSGQPLVACFAPYGQRFADAGIDMGSGYDCLDPLSHNDAKISAKANANRKLLQQQMEQNGFEPYAKEWWHFTLKNEPHPNTYYDFPVE